MLQFQGEPAQSAPPPAHKWAIVPYQGSSGDSSPEKQNDRMWDLDNQKLVPVQAAKSPTKQFAKNNAFLYGGLCVPGGEAAIEDASAKGSIPQKKKETTNNAGHLLFEDELEIMDKALGQEVSKEKQKACAKIKPAASGKKLQKPKQAMKSTNKNKKKKGQETKNSFRHRATSSAYHAAKERAEALGKSLNS